MSAYSEAVRGPESARIWITPIEPAVARTIDRCLIRLEMALAHGAPWARKAKSTTGGMDSGIDELLAVTLPPRCTDQTVKRNRGTAGRRSRTGMCVRVLGKSKQLPSEQLMKLVEALAEAADFGLTLTEAKKLHSNASKVLNALCKEDADWRAAIELPTNGKGGYRLRKVSEAIIHLHTPEADQVPTKYR
jgi:hypothetical protein